MGKYLLNGVQSARLYFRKVRPSDIHAWLPFYEDPMSTQYWKGHPKDSLRACQAQFKGIFERYEKGLGGMNALINRKSEALVGLCGLLVQFVDGVEELEIGYAILPEFRKQGFAAEAAKSCKDHAFRTTPVPSLIAIIHTENLPSRKVAIGNGMQLDKTTSYKGNPVHIFRICKHEYVP